MEQELYGDLFFRLWDLILFEFHRSDFVPCFDQV